MKFLLLFSLLMSSVLSYGEEIPDIYMATNLEKNWSHLFFRQLRSFLKNIDVNDPLKATIPGGIELYSGNLKELTGAEDKDLVFIDEAFNIDLNQSATKISINELGFEFIELQTNLKKHGITRNGDILWRGDFSGQGLWIGGKNVDIEIDLFENSELLPIKLKIMNPEIMVKDQNAFKFFSKVAMVNNGMTTNINFQSADFSRTIEWLLENPNEIILSIGEIIASEVSVEIGSKKIIFSEEKLNKIVLKRLDQIKELVVDIFIMQLKKGAGLELLKKVEKFHYTNNAWVETDSFNFSWNLEKIRFLEITDGVQVDFSSKFCLPIDFDQKDRTCKQMYQAAPSFSYPEKTYQKSRMNVQKLLRDKQANLIFSFSEDYINNLLVRTVDAGFWKEALIENSLELGPRGVFTRLDQKGEMSLYIDIVFLAKKLIKGALGTKDIRFPVKILLDFRIEERGGEPVFVIQIRDFDMTNESLLEGYKNLGLDSSLHQQKRLKKLTAGTILKELEPYKKTDIFILPISVLKGLKLTKSVFESDGLGRLNTLIKYEEEP